MIFLQLFPQLCASIDLKLIDRKRLPFISASESSLLTSDDAAGPLNDQVTAGQLASSCQYWVV
jgi:hypothetical protein